jgi:hypothetical protein
MFPALAYIDKAYEIRYPELSDCIAATTGQHEEDDSSAEY